jgi:hypothetical protein
VGIEGKAAEQVPQQAEFEFRDDGTFTASAYVTKGGTVEKRTVAGTYEVLKENKLRVSVPGKERKPPVKFRVDGNELVLDDIQTDVRTRFERIQEP